MRFSGLRKALKGINKICEIQGEDFHFHFVRRPVALRIGVRRVCGAADCGGTEQLSDLAGPGSAGGAGIQPEVIDQLPK